MSPQPFTLKKIALFLMAPAALAAAHANETQSGVLTGSEEIQSQTIRVDADIDAKRDNPTATVVTKKDIQREMIRNAKDLTRYDTDLGVADGGRFQKGFSLRGVEGNRVGITIDGVTMPDSEENSLFARYGNFNSSRPYVDSELVSHIDIDRGSDSFLSGAGALGGSVNYYTLNPSDLIISDRPFGILARTGYASKNREWFQTVGTAFSGEHLSTLLLYSHRYGHQYNSTGKVLNEEKNYGQFSQKPNPQTHHYHSLLGKVHYQITPNHRVGIEVNGQRNSDKVDQRSYTANTYNMRYADDKMDRYGGKIFYEYLPDDGLFSAINVTANYQKTKITSQINVFTDNTDTWSWAQNPDGSWPDWLQLITHDEEKNRSMINSMGRLTLDTSLAPFTFANGEHTVQIKTYAGIRRFENDNLDYVITYDDDKNEIYNTDGKYTIQYPVKNRLVGFSIQDDIAWTPEWFKGVDSVVSAHLGARIDHQQLKPEDIDVLSYTATTLGGTPDTKKFTNTSWRLGFDYTLNNTWIAGYQFATGYRVPTASEMYFTFYNQAGSWYPNPKLKTETSKSHTIFLRARGDVGSIDLSLYRINYKDFLMEHVRMAPPGSNDAGKPIMQMKNYESAKITGIEAKGVFNLKTIHRNLNGLSVSAAVGYSEGETNNGNNLLPIQPVKLVGGLDFEAPSGKWAVYNRLTYNGRKKPQFAQTEIWSQDGMTTEQKTWPFLSKAVTLWDMYGWYSPCKNVTIHAGVFNITNRHYISWDALRGINLYGTVNNIDPTKPQHQLGFQRYYAPGRNFAASLEFAF